MMQEEESTDCEHEHEHEHEHEQPSSTSGNKTKTRKVLSIYVHRKFFRYDQSFIPQTTLYFVEKEGSRNTHQEGKGKTKNKNFLFYSFLIWTL